MDDQIKFNFEELPNCKVVDAFEAHPCQVIGHDSDNCEIIEQCEDEEADFYSVYAHNKEGGLCCIADCQTKELAETLENFLTELMYKTI